MIETEQSIFSERRYELDGEKRIAASLLVHQLRERRGALRLAAKSVRDQLSEMLWFERRKRDLRHFSASGPDGVELPHQRMGGCDFIVAIGADQHEVPQIRPVQQILQQIERRRVEPLQVVEDERQRMFRPREHADEAPEYELEPRLCLLRLKLGNRRLLADDEFQFWDNVGHEAAIRSQRLEQRVAASAPTRHRSCSSSDRTRLSKA